MTSTLLLHTLFQEVVVEFVAVDQVTRNGGKATPVDDSIRKNSIGLKSWIEPSMESRVPVSGTSCIVQARRHVPWMAKVWTAWPRSKATRISLRRFCVIDHAGRIRKVSLPGFAIPQIPN